MNSLATEKRDFLKAPLPLAPEFLRNLRLLGRRPTLQQINENLIKKYGTHFLVSATLGGKEVTHSPLFSGYEMSGNTKNRDLLILVLRGIIALQVECFRRVESIPADILFKEKCQVTCRIHQRLFPTVISFSSFTMMIIACSYKGLTKQMRDYIDPFLSICLCFYWISFYPRSPRREVTHKTESQGLSIVCVRQNRAETCVTTS